MNPELCEDDLAGVSTLQELLMLTLFLCAVYGENSGVSFSAGFNNIDVTIIPENEE